LFDATSVVATALTLRDVRFSPLLTDAVEKGLVIFGEQ
jgi:hypothetical protein